MVKAFLGHNQLLKLARILPFLAEKCLWFVNYRFKCFLHKINNLYVKFMNKINKGVSMYKV